MLGGYQIIDLRKIGLELKDTQQTISDAEILKQLRNLRDYIEKGHDYSKALNNSLKPILIRYRDAKNDEKKEVTSFASIINENASLTFTIASKHLEIEIVFEEKTDDDGNKYYDIKTAKYLYSLNEVIEGDLSVIGDIEGDNISGNEIIEKMSGYSAVKGSDADDFTPIYVGVCKNGNKITFVVFGTIYFETAATSVNPTLVNFTIPDEVFDKLYPYTIAGNERISQGTVALFSGIGTTKTLVHDMTKITSPSNRIRVDLRAVDTLTPNTTYVVRIEQTFLLSDNLIPQE